MQDQFLGVSILASPFRECSSMPFVQERRVDVGDYGGGERSSHILRLLSHMGLVAAPSSWLFVGQGSRFQEPLADRSSPEIGSVGLDDEQGGATQSSPASDCRGINAIAFWGRIRSLVLPLPID